MGESAWREVWPQYRVDFVDETARCLANHQSLVTHGKLHHWAGLTEDQRTQLTEYVAWVFLAQEQAMENLVKRGQFP